MDPSPHAQYRREGNTSIPEDYIGYLQEGAIVKPGLAAEMHPPNSYYDCPGQLPEYQLENASVDVLLPQVQTLNPLFGGNPDQPPPSVPECPPI